MINKKDEILISARELFTNYGYKKVSMDEIAKNAGVTKKTVYSYFMKGIITKYSDEKDFFEGVNKVLYELLRYKKEAKLFITLSKEADELNTISSKNSIKMFDDGILDFIKMRLSWAIDKGYIKDCDVDLCAFIIYKVYVSVIFEWDKELDEKKVTENITKILKEGLFN